MPRRQSSAQLTEDQKDKLISLVHKNKAIWCKKEKAFMRTDILSKLWNAISDEMGIESKFFKFLKPNFFFLFFLFLKSN